MDPPLAPESWGQPFRPPSEAERNTAPWRRVSSLAMLRGAAERGRGLYAEAHDEDPPLALFAYGESVYAIADACPHAGHQMSKADLLVTDIEDVAPGCGIGAIVACPAHAFTYDMESGYCLSNPGRTGGRASRWATRIAGDDVFVGARLPESDAVPSVSKKQADAIQLALVSQALDRKYGAGK